MCGIFGAIQTGERPLSLSVVKSLAEANEKRGPHAFGFAWIDKRNRVHHFKSPGLVSEALILVERMEGAKAIIGHTRFATHGDPANNANNHPHHADGGFIVHNGQIPNHTELALKHDLLSLTDCDSEILGLMIQHLPGRLGPRLVNTINACDRTAPLNMAGIWSRPNRVVIAKRGNPLSYVEGKSGNVYFGSKMEGFPKSLKVRAFPHNNLWVVDITAGTITERKLDPFIETKKVWAGSNVFRTSGTMFHGTDSCPDDRCDIEDHKRTAKPKGKARKKAKKKVDPANLVRKRDLDLWGICPKCAEAINGDRCDSCGWDEYEELAKTLREWQ